MAYQRVLFEHGVLRQAREKLGLTQQQVADQANIHQRQYQRFESGERNLSSSSFNIACRVLDVLQLDIAKYAHGDYIFSEETMEIQLDNPTEDKKQ
ncbi:hypothetical protein Hs30E_18820 [Lactococcus hodotermopsidis]|uniref:HTH cro/C1-type domain-containing protein n=1 Tax=Pseudolactococcus hodotermopsidis TaxID=2709157 RepID=A0A6A0BGE1_9LACT|nr:helix-turn-helix transcriptional regulator [Lactococcus hodotermopsidis]GFH43331.1 hypothetical protein Hs30E_18820 [Lactococcus hodotermopsidis]